MQAVADEQFPIHPCFPILFEPQAQDTFYVLPGGRQEDGQGFDSFFIKCPADEHIQDGFPVTPEIRVQHHSEIRLALFRLQASPAGSAIEVTLKQLGDRDVVMAIRDHGRGIRGEDLPRIFEPFFTTKPSGSGLGLAIVKGVIEDHKGATGVTSSESKGTTFTIIFPSTGAKSA